jgi:hypothetical protein
MGLSASQPITKELFCFCLSSSINRKERGMKFNTRKSMPFWRMKIVFSVCFYFMTGFAGFAIGAALHLSPELAKGKLLSSYGKIPLTFISNQGQMDPSVKFHSRGSGYGLFFSANEITLTLNRGLNNAAIQVQLLDSNPSSKMKGLNELPGKANYFVGNDPNKWHARIPMFTKVRASSVYPGIDLVYYGNQRQLEYDFIVAPGADAKAIKLGFKGSERIEIDSKGDLLIFIPGGRAIERKPFVYQEAGGLKNIIAGRWVLQGKNRASFEIGKYDGRKPLVIDPILSYSTYLGGVSGDYGIGIAVDASGAAYMTGRTFGSFPAVNAFQPIHGSAGDVFVSKLNVEGTALVYSTYLGGNSDDEEGFGIAVDSSGAAYVTGYTSSSNFPIANPLQANKAGGRDAFITKLNAEGSALIYSTYLGGSGEDVSNDIAVDASGQVYLAGYTRSGNFPLVYPIQTDGDGKGNAFVSKLNAGGSALIYSTYIGGLNGNDGDGGLAIAIDNEGSAYIAGYSGSSDFPTTANAFQSANRGSRDAVVFKLNPSGTALVYSTYLGGSGVDLGAYDIAVDDSGAAYVTGETWSSDFPMANALQSNHGVGQEDGFVSKLSSDGSTLVYSTYLWGSKPEVGKGIAVDASGNAYITGYTNSPEFSVVNAVQPSYGGDPYDAFIAELNTEGSALVYSTYLGGSGDDRALSIALDSFDNAYVAGFTTSSNFYIANPIQAENAGESDAFIAKLSKDVTPPVIVPSVTPTPNGDGWNMTDVMLTWSVTDPESGIKSSSGCDAVTFSNETTGTTATCSATNGAGLSNSASVTIKIDKTPPILICSASPSLLWPPNHKLRPVQTTVAVSDFMSGASGFVLASASSSEPDEGLGDGDTSNDIQGFIIGGPSISGLLRAERSGAGDGRIYTLVYQSVDNAGNTNSCSAVVEVPHDKRK